MITYHILIYGLEFLNKYHHEKAFITRYGYYHPYLCCRYFLLVVRLCSRKCLNDLGGVIFPKSPTNSEKCQGFAPAFSLLFHLVPSCVS